MKEHRESAEYWLKKEVSTNGKVENYEDLKNLSQKPQKWWIPMKKVKTDDSINNP